jgi:hypothetical protein
MLPGLEKYASSIKDCVNQQLEGLGPVALAGNGSFLAFRGGFLSISACMSVKCLHAVTFP